MNALQRWVFFLNVLVLIFCVTFYNFQYEKFVKIVDSTFLQNIAMGLIAFSIPFLWNAHQKIMIFKKSSIEENLNSILNKAFYNKSIRYFEICIQYPSSLFVVMSLIIIPFAERPLFIIFFLLFFFLYFSSLPLIFEFIENKSSIGLKDFIKQVEPASKDCELTFLELFKMNDNDIKEKFSLDIRDIMENYEKVVNKVIQDANISKKLIDIYMKNMKFRSSYVHIDLLPKLLEWNYVSYVKSQQEVKDKYVYAEINNKLEEFIDITFSENFTNYNLWSFFQAIELHLKNHINDNGYIKRVMLDLFKRIILDIGDSKESNLLWQAFPRDWLVTKENIEKPINKILRDVFFYWAGKRFNSSNTYDKVIADIAPNLFVNIEPMTFASLFILLAKQDIQEVLEISLGFGGAGRIFTGFGDEVDTEAMENRDILQRKETYEIFKTRYPRFFNKINIEAVVAELNSIVDLETVDKWQEIRRKRLVTYLNEMLEIL